MKALILAFGMVMSGSAFAFVFDMPNMDSMVAAQKKAIRSDVSVKNYAASLNGTALQVNLKRNDIFKVQTNSGCSFNVQVVYEPSFFDGIKDVVVLDNTTICN